MQPVNHSPGSASAFSKYCLSPWLSAVKEFAKQRILSNLEDIIGGGGEFACKKTRETSSSC